MNAATLRFTALASLVVTAAAFGQSTPSGSEGRLTIGAEATAWWYKSSPTPVPVVVSGGAIGQPATNILLGGGHVDTNPNPGFRVFADYPVDPQWGATGDIFYVPRRSTTSSVSSSGTNGSTDLLLPFYDVTRNRESVTAISFAPLFAGAAKVELTNELMGAELDATWTLASPTPWKTQLLGGFRWLKLKETYRITTSSPAIAPFPESLWSTTDSFDASNNFYGAQLGARARYEEGAWRVNGVVKIGLGAMEQKVAVNGSLTTDDFAIGAAPRTFAGGYFALPTNMGDHSRTTFAAVPEVKLDIGYRVTPAVTAFVGYSFLYASSVARPGNQIDRNINPTQSVSYVRDLPANIVGPAQPGFSFNSSSFWAQGVSVGLGIVF